VKKFFDATGGFDAAVNEDDDDVLQVSDPFDDTFDCSEKEDYVGTSSGSTCFSTSPSELHVTFNNFTGSGK